MSRPKTGSATTSRSSGDERHAVRARAGWSPSDAATGRHGQRDEHADHGQGRCGRPGSGRAGPRRAEDRVARIAEARRCRAGRGPAGHRPWPRPPRSGGEQAAEVAAGAGRRRRHEPTGQPQVAEQDDEREQPGRRRTAQTWAPMRVQKTVSKPTLLVPQRIGQQVDPDAGQDDDRDAGRRRPCHRPRWRPPPPSRSPRPRAARSPRFARRPVASGSVVVRVVVRSRSSRVHGASRGGGRPASGSLAAGHGLASAQLLQEVVEQVAHRPRSLAGPCATPSGPVEALDGPAEARPGRSRRARCRAWSRRARARTGRPPGRPAGRATAGSDRRAATSAAEAHLEPAGVLEDQPGQGAGDARTQAGRAADPAADPRSGRRPGS